MAYRIKWMSASTWAGTTQVEHEGNEVFETLEQAEAALAEMQADETLMQDVHAAAVEGQGVEGWLKIEKDV